MKRMAMAVLITGVLLFVVLLSSSCCNQRVPKEDYDAVVRERNQYLQERNDLEEQVGELQSQLAELQGQLAEFPHDPTFYELEQFVDSDDTHEHFPRQSPQYAERAHMMIGNAVEKGIRAFPVYIELEDNSFFTVVGFNTVDHGLIYVIPGYRFAVKAQIGEDFYKLNDWPDPGEDATIVGIWVYDFH